MIIISNMVKKKSILTFFLLFGLFIFLPKDSLAIKFDLIAPSGQLTRGQNIDFTINIDTQSVAVTSQQIGFTYDTEYLSYVGVNPGTAMTSVTTSDQGGGKLLLSGTNSAGFTGAGSFAVVTLKLIATSAGSTELCALWSPQPTPTTAPLISSTPGPTSPPPPPRTGSTETTAKGIVLGGALILGASGLFIYRKNLDHQHHRSSLKKR